MKSRCCEILSGVALLCVIAVSCSSVDNFQARERQYVPRVSLPESGNMNSNERRYIPEVQDALGDAGYRTVNGPAEFRLAFSMEDGPINADTALSLYRGEVETASAKARVGGPRIIFRRSSVVRESFEKCLADFEAKVPRVNNLGGVAPSTDGGFASTAIDGGTAYPSRSGSGGYQTYPDYGQAYGGGNTASSAPDWQTGWR